MPMNWFEHGEKDADDECPSQAWTEQIMEFVRHLGFQFDRGLDVIGAQACAFGAEDVLEHRETFIGSAYLNEESWAFRCPPHSQQEGGGRNRA